MTTTTPTTAATRPTYEHPATDDLELLLGTLPPHVRKPLDSIDDLDQLLEIVLDLGRLPEARFPDREVILSDDEVTTEDLDYVVSRIGSFGDDNRAGIPRTLHRISAIRNRKREVVGLTCRVGRSVLGTMDIIRDLVESGKSTLILGKPGIGKTTLLREVARVLADELRKRVIIVDTSNEIAGDGDIPHAGIGRARRMQVPTPTEQHGVMIEAVENHMPEVIVIDEIGTALEAEAARTIAERGVQLVGTAHGNGLDNLLVNPTLSDLVGGIQPVTLGDEEARRRGTQKTVLERKAPPTFDVLVEMQERQKVAVHRDVAETVDAILRSQPVPVEIRWRGEDGAVQRRLEVPARFGLADDRGRGGRGSSDAGYGDRRDRAERWDRGGRRGRSGFWNDRALILEHDAVERGQNVDGPLDRGAGNAGRSQRHPADSAPARLPEGGPSDPAPAPVPVPWSDGDAAPSGEGATTVVSGAAVAERPRAPRPASVPESSEDVLSGSDQPSSLGRVGQPGQVPQTTLPGERFQRTRATAMKPIVVYPFGVNRDRLEAAVAAMRLPVTITKEPRDADVVMTLKNYYRTGAGPVRDAEEVGKPVFILKSNTIGQIQQSLEALYGMQTADPPRDLEDLVLQETQDAIHRVLASERPVELPPQNAYIRRLQHQLAEQHNVGSRSAGREPHRRVQLFKPAGEGAHRRDRW